MRLLSTHFPLWLRRFGSLAIILSVVFGQDTVFQGVPAQAALTTEVKVGLGSYNAKLPAGGKVPSDKDGKIVTPTITSNITLGVHVPTNDWWSSLIWKRFPKRLTSYPNNAYSENMYPHPLSLQAKPNGLGVGYVTTVITNTTNLKLPVPTPNPRYDVAYHYKYSEDLTIGVEGLSSTDTKVDDFSDWTVTAFWPDKDSNDTLKATFGHGLPFVYAIKTGGDALITTSHTFTTWAGTGTNALGIAVNGHYYGVFAPTGAIWTVNNDNNQLRSNLNGREYFSVAVLPTNNIAVLNKFKTYAYSFVTDTQVNWSYDSSVAELNTTYTITTNPKEGSQTGTLMALYPHQWSNTVDVVLDPATYFYESPRGKMRIREGSSFGTTMKFNGVLPALPNNETYDEATLVNYVHGVATSNLFPPGLEPQWPYSTYWTGKNLGRLAQVVRIADQLSLDCSLTFDQRAKMGNDREILLKAIKDELQKWFQAPDGDGYKMFYYDDTWDTLIGFPSSHGSDTELNDHHFHYGYFIMAAATVAQYDPLWARDESWGGMVKLLIRDANSWERNDNLFPFLRHFDPYAGHSWASGHANFTSDSYQDNFGKNTGNNQESSSESINFSAALILWGAATGDNTTRDLGIFMYVNEVAAIEQYWFDINDNVFPTEYEQKVLGILWGDGGAHGVWWTMNPEEIHGINFLPITGGSLYLGRNPGYIDLNYNEMVAENGGLEKEWRDIIWEFQALSDAPIAVGKFNDNYTPEFGESKAHTYHWIYNLDAMGQLDTTVWATNTPTYAVFNKNGTKTYVAYNPGLDLVVTFSDGATLDVPARSLKSSGDSGTTCSPTPNLISPVGGYVPPSLRQLFDWANVVDATSYRIQIAKDKNFTPPLVLNTDTDMGVTPSAYTANLPPNTLLYWRVRANGPCDNNPSVKCPGPWSRVRHFYSPNPPGAPVLISPANGEKVNSTKPTLDWSDTAPTLGYYEIQISTDQNFVPGTVLGRGQGGRTAISQYTPEVPLTSNTTFFWRARAVNEQGQFSQWSVVRSFKTP